MIDIGDIIKNDNHAFYRKKLFLVVDVEKIINPNKTISTVFVLFGFDDGNFIKVKIFSDTWKKVA